MANRQVCAMAIEENGNTSLHYVYTDHLGSINAVTSAAGVLEAKLDFDAYGRRRNPVDYSYLPNNTIQIDNGLNTSSTLPAWLHRGYTGHEMLDEFNLIHMNGRVYDPDAGVMLSPDPAIQQTLNADNYNLYSYALNNPLRYTDPTGNILASPFQYGMLAVDYLSYAPYYDNAWQRANYNTKSFISELNNAFRKKLINNPNYYVSAGLDPLNFGVSIDAAYQNGNFSASGVVGLNPGGFYGGASARYGNDRYALSLAAAISNTGNSAGATLETPAFNVSGYYAPNGERAQWSGAVTAKIPVKNKTLSITVDNDVFLSWLDKDEWNTGALEFQYDDYSVGMLVVTNNIRSVYHDDHRDPRVKDQDYIEYGKHSPIWRKNKTGKGAWIGGEVLLSPAYIGTRNGNQNNRFGFSHKIVQDFTQNGLHQMKPFATHYFLDYTNLYTGWWGQTRYYRSSTLY